jgi:VanZ family protein
MRHKDVFLPISKTNMLKLIIFLRPFARYLLIAWVLTILIFSSIPNIPTLKIHTARAEIRLDYLFHFCEYGFLSFVAFLSFAGNEFRIIDRKIVLITLGLILFAIADELHQKLIPGRSYNLSDILSNISGIVAGTLFSLLAFRIVKSRVAKMD